MKVTSEEYDELPFEAVESSNITRAAFVESGPSPANPAVTLGQLYVEFHGEPTRAYRYDNVPEALRGDLMHAASVGSFFANNIKGRFECERVEIEDA